MIDAHTHLHLHPLPQAAIEKARSQGVSTILVCATQPSDFEAVYQLCCTNPEVLIPSFGVHPYHALSSGPPSHWISELDRFVALSKSRGMRPGVGECGLDKSPKGLERSSWDAQISVFSAQLKYAASQKLPISIHCVRSQRDLLSILQEIRPGPAGLLLHSWAGKPGDALRLQSLGIPCVFSFSGAIVSSAVGGTHGASKDCLESLKKLPPASICFETDSPDQTFVHGLTKETLESWGEERFIQSEGALGELPTTLANSPEFLPLVYRAGALLRGTLTKDEFCFLQSSCEENVLNMFKR